MLDCKCITLPINELDSRLKLSIFIDYYTIMHQSVFNGTFISSRVKGHTVRGQFEHICYEIFKFK